MNERIEWLDLWRDSEEGLFLLNVLRRGRREELLPEQHVQEFVREITRSASHLMDERVLTAPPGQARSGAMTDALHRVSLGLEYEAEGDDARGVALLRRTAYAQLAQTGRAILATLRERAEEVQSLLRLKSELPTLLSVLDELDLANNLETAFLDALQRGRLTLIEPAPRLEKLASARPIASLHDVQQASEMLQMLAARGEMFAQMPRRRLFAQTYPTDSLGDTARIVISRLFVRLAVSGSPAPRFDVTSEEVTLFESIRDEPAVWARLREWIAQFTEQNLSPFHQQRARAYLEACLDSLPDALPLLIE